MSKEPKKTKVYTINSLITEITGISEHDNVTYEAARRDIYRIAKSIRTILDFDRGSPKAWSTLLLT